MSDNAMSAESVFDIHGKPRRSNPDTIQYLRSLPLISNDTDQNDDDDIAYVMIQALYEVRHEFASLASTEIGSSVLEHLMRAVVSKSATIKNMLWQGLMPYVNFLATHRYGSHVLQVLVSETTRQPADTDIAMSENAPEFPEQQQEKVTCDWRLVLANSISSETLSAWMVDMCASHVLRSLLASLDGRISIVQSVEGKTNKKKKKHKRKRDEEYSVVNNDMPKEFAKALDNLSKSIWGTFDENWPYNVSACPVLCLIVKDKSFDSNEILEDWMYDPTASRFWQASVMMASSVDSIADKYRKNVKLYIENDTANYCVQTMLEYHHHWVEECLEELPYLVDPANNRRGVLWKLAVASQLDHQKDRIIKSIERYDVSKFVKEGAPSLATLVALLPTIEPLLLPVLDYACRNSLASKILIEPWIEQARAKFPLDSILSEIVNHPVGQHVVAKYVLETGTIPEQMWGFQRTNHPIVKRLVNERLQLPLYEEKGAKAWKEALGITSRKKGEPLRRNVLP